MVNPASNIFTNSPIISFILFGSSLTASLMTCSSHFLSSSLIGVTCDGTVPSEVCARLHFNNPSQFPAPSIVVYSYVLSKVNE
jgi:hypothetical protein